MKNIRNIDVFQIETRNGMLYAHISFQDLTNISDINQGYDHIIVPVNPREYQYSSRDNVLVNQSEPKENVDVQNNVV